MASQSETPVVAVTNPDADSKQSTESKPGCVFCNVSEERGFKIVLQDEKVVVFHDRSPAAREHLLVVPRKHLTGVNELTIEHIPLIKEMEAAGHRAVDKLSDAYPRDERIMGFHIPPLQMIKHLHLHVIVPPYKGFLSKMLYPVSKGNDGNSKGYSFFITSSQAIEVLQKGRKVTFSPC